MMADSGDGIENNADSFDSRGHDPSSHDGEEPEPKGIRNDEAHLDPSRYWFLSSAFPMVAATLGPVANAFSVCALVRPWRQYYPPGSDIDKASFIADPIWYVIALGHWPRRTSRHLCCACVWYTMHKLRY